jgi:hypothetical protein
MLMEDIEIFPEVDTSLPDLFIKQNNGGFLCHQ